MNDQVAVLESIRDVLSGKIPASPAETAADAEEILDLTKLVNDDGSITDLENPEANIIADTIKEEEMANVSTTAGDDVLDEIDRLLAGETDGGTDTVSPETEVSVAKMDEPLESISDDTIELELAEETKQPEPIDSMDFDSIAPQTTEVEETMTDNHDNNDMLISDESADKAKSAIAGLLKVTGKEKPAPAPHTPSPSFRNGDTVEDLVMESLKPMLKKWLDENLNSLVEEIVQKEISRIIPK